MEDINCWESQFESCYYSDRLLNKVLLLNEKAESKVDITEVKKAIYYARKYHGDQKRQSGEPYYSHPLEVAYMVSDYLFRTDIIITSILHDTIEDTKLTKDLIELIFGSILANQVEDLTRIKQDRKISSAEMVASLWLQKKYDVLLIKQFDRLHNMQTIGVKSPEKIKKIVEETIVNFITLAIYLEMPLIRRQLTRLCYQTLGITPPLIDEREISFVNDNFQLAPLTFQNETPQSHILQLPEIL